MKYVEDMQMCSLEEDEGLNNLDTPAELIKKCDYRTKEGFCVYCIPCDFLKTLEKSDADMLNGK